MMAVNATIKTAGRHCGPGIEADCERARRDALRHKRDGCQLSNETDHRSRNFLLAT
jgi:hypothetical protein